MRRDTFIDFHLVRDEHLSIHEDLCNWSRWVRVRPHGWQVQPMFRHYKPEKATEGWWERRAPKQDVDILRAVEIEKVVAQLPDKHRDVIRWQYFWSTIHRDEARAGGWPHDPNGIARKLGLSKADLLQMLHDARTMIVNRTCQPAH